MYIHVCIVLYSTTSDPDKTGCDVLHHLTFMNSIHRLLTYVAQILTCKELTQIFFCLLTASRLDPAELTQGRVVTRAELETGRVDPLPVRLQLAAYYLSRTCVRHSDTKPLASLCLDFRF